MIREMTAEELDRDCPIFTAVKAKDMVSAKLLLNRQFLRVEYDEEQEYLRVYDAESPEQVVKYLYDNGVTVSEIMTDKIGLEEYYVNLMEGKNEKLN